MKTYALGVVSAFCYCSPMVSTPAQAASAAARPLTVVYRPTASLVPDPRNARTHPRRQVEQIAASIRAFGFTNPVLADPEGRLIAGHGRVLAARELGLGEVPVIELGGLSEGQKKALRLCASGCARWPPSAAASAIGVWGMGDANRHFPNRGRRGRRHHSQVRKRPRATFFNGVSRHQ